MPCLKPFVAVWEECDGDSHGDYGKRVGGQRAMGVKDERGVEMGMGMGMEMEMGKDGESANTRVLVEQEGEEMN